MDTLTELILRVNAGDTLACEQLFSATYDELKKLARSRLRGGGRSNVLETTSLVHESYLRFLKVGQLRLDDGHAFFGYASKVMRSVIVDAVRERQAQRHGGDAPQITLDSALENVAASGEAQILAVHDALLSLEEMAPRLYKVVEMRYFGGYSMSEIAEALELDRRTVTRDWEKARMLLEDVLRS